MHKACTLSRCKDQKGVYLLENMKRQAKDMKNRQGVVSAHAPL